MPMGALVSCYSTQAPESSLCWFPPTVPLRGRRGAETTGDTLGAGKLEEMKSTSADVVGLDWGTEISAARAALGPQRIVQGNVDPMVLFGTEEVIRAEVARCLSQAGPKGHILNVGHGVAQGTPEDNVKLFCQLAYESGEFFAKQGAQKAAALA